jgi:rubrerythrin
MEMNIYEFAMQMEKDGEKYYRDLMNASTLPGLKKIFAYLADEEVKHFAYIEKLRQEKDINENITTGILENVKNIFVEMKDEKQAPDANTLQAKTAFIKARDIEETSKNFYLEKAEEATDEKTKNLLVSLAREELKHFYIMENLIEFVSRPEPGNWLENAEWHHLDEY